MKRILMTFIAITIILCFFSGCIAGNAETDYTITEEPHLYWKDIDVVVTDIDKRHWFAGTHWYSVQITVESEEYNLERTIEFKGSGAFGKPGQWDYKTGDIVTAQLYSWVMDSTGEVVRRKINTIY